MSPMLRLLVAFLMAASLFAEPPATPEPPKADLPYLLMGDSLVPTDAVESSADTQNKGKRSEETTYAIPGEHASAKTPLASPIFVIKQQSLELEKLSVYPFQVRNGRREITFSRKNEIKPFRLTITKAAEGIYRIEVDQSLPPGEYAVTPSGSNQVFCFSVY